MAEHVGWTLREAIRRSVDPDLLTKCVVQKRQRRQAEAACFNPVTEALRSNLISGELVARGRRGSPDAESGLIPGSAWKTLNFDDLKRSIACEPPPHKTKIYDLRFVSALCADDILDRLDGQPLVQAFKRFVFDDQHKRQFYASHGRANHPGNIWFRRFARAFCLSKRGLSEGPAATAPIPAALLLRCTYANSAFSKTSLTGTMRTASGLMARG